MPVVTIKGARPKLARLTKSKSEEYPGAWIDVTGWEIYDKEDDADITGAYEDLRSLWRDCNGLLVVGEQMSADDPFGYDAFRVPYAAGRAALRDALAGREREVDGVVVGALKLQRRDGVCVLAPCGHRTFLPRTTAQSVYALMPKLKPLPWA